MDLDYWVDFFDLNEDAETHAAKLRSLGLESTFIRPDWTLQVTPYLIDGKSTKSQATAYAALYKTITQLPDLLFRGDLTAFAKAVGFSDEKHLSLLEGLDRNDGMLPCRWDVCAKDGTWLAMEANFGGALGGLPNDPLQKYYDQIQDAVGDPPNEWHSAGAAMADAIRAISGTPNEVQVVVVDDSGHLNESPLTANSAASVLAHHLDQSVQAIGHTELECYVENTDKRIVLFELFTLKDIAAAHESYRPYLRLCETGRVLRGVNLLCDLFMSKAILALLHQAANNDLVSADVKDIITSAVPHTMIVTAKNHHELAQLPKDRYVLKSAIGHGGSGVFCGWEQGDDTWADLLDRAADPSADLGLCVIQARVEGDRREVISITPNGQWIESDAPQVLGIFQIDGQFCGGGVRQSIEGSGVVNAAKMAAVGVLRMTPTDGLNHSQPGTVT